MFINNPQQNTLFYKMYIFFVIKKISFILSLALSLYGIIALFFFDTFFLPLTTTASIAISFIFVCLLATALNLKKINPSKIHFDKTTFGLLLILFLFRTASLWAIETFPLSDVKLVVATLQMPVEGFSLIYTIPVMCRIFLPSLILSLCCTLILSTIATFCVHSNIKYLSFASLYILLSIQNFSLLTNDISIVDYAKEIKNATNDAPLQNSKESPFFKNNFIEPDSINIHPYPTPHANPRNLILIFMESMESTFASSAIGGDFSENYIPELSSLASENINFSNTNKLGGGYDVPGTNNTILATIAKTFGFPTLNGKYYDQHLIPRIKGLYTILKQHSYTNVYSKGTHGVFSSTEPFYLKHGVDDFYDYSDFKRTGVPVERVVKFLDFEQRITDKNLFEASKKILDTLAKKQPFSYSLVTVSTHPPHGLYDKNCKEKPKSTSDEDYFKATIKCSSQEVFEFVQWIKSQPYGSNTEIIILGDHLFMGKTLVEHTKKDRRWINIFINPYISTQNKQNRTFTSMDIFPSILESMGFIVPGHRLGFGTSLFSNEKTLSEKIGTQTLNEKLSTIADSKNYLEKYFPIQIGTDSTNLLKNFHLDYFTGDIEYSSNSKSN